MDDDLDRIRKQFEAERKAAEEARARREAERKKEAAYETAWNRALQELRRLDGDPAAVPDLEPIAALTRELANWQRIEWLVEIRDNFRDELARGLDTPDGGRRAEIWFVNTLLCFAHPNPDLEKPRLLLNEMRRTGFSPFGMASIADDVKDSVRDHLAVMEQMRRQKHAEMLEKASAVVRKLAARKTAIRRNLQFAIWSNEKLKPSQICKRWNAEHPKDSVGTGKTGIGVVKQGRLAARTFLKDLANAGFPLTAREALERLPTE